MSTVLTVDKHAKRQPNLSASMRIWSHDFARKLNLKVDPNGRKPNLSKGWKVSIMDKTSINSPYNLIYPLSYELSIDPFIVYHGTSSVYTEEIEKNGWCINGVSYSLEDIQQMCDIHKSIGSFSIRYKELDAYKYGRNYINGNKTSSFTDNYWKARNYSSYSGGETIRNFISAADYFVGLVENEEKHLEHIKNLNKKIDEAPPSPPYIQECEDCIKRFNNKKLLQEYHQQVIRLRKKYEDLYTNVYPVIYALKIEPDWFKKWEPFVIDGRNLRGQINLAAKGNIPAVSIVARVDYNNGVKHWMYNHCGPFPYPWTLDEFNAYKEKSFCYGQDYLFFAEQTY